MLFSQIDWGYGYWDEDHGGKVVLSPLTPRATHHHRHLCWCWPWSPGWGVIIRFLHCNAALPASPFSYHPLGRKSLCTTHPEGVGVEKGVFPEAIWNFCMGNMSILLYLNNCIQSLIYIRMDSWVFILYFVQVCINNTILCLFLLKLFQLWSLGAFSWLLCPSDIRPLVERVEEQLFVFWGPSLPFSTTKRSLLILLSSSF